MATNRNWNPFSTAAWAQAIGLAHVSLFGASRPNHVPGDLAVLLDGRRSSLGLYAAKDQEELLYSPEPLSWSWSANLRHTLIVGNRGVVCRRWDAPDDLTRFPLPDTASEAGRIFGRIEKTRVERPTDVISKLLTAFRQVRNTLAPYSTDPVVAIRVFNAFLLGTELVRFGGLSDNTWRKCETVGDALRKAGSGYTHFEEVPDAVQRVQIGDLLATFLDPDPYTECQLEPDLLIRHASGVLYQEAHFELQRSDQFSFPGMASAAPALQAPQLNRDARFTPPPLARAMVQQATEALGPDLPSRQQGMVLLDPACGSGIFLQQALQELVEINYRSPVKLVGYDTSPISCEIAKFCLGRAVQDAPQGMPIEVEICHTDALQAEWPECDLILTNPPFAAWRKMPSKEKSVVKDVLGPLFKGHMDKAMAFVWKGVQRLRPGGVLASIVPSPFLQSNNAEKWRAAILGKANISLVGRFSGFSFFQNAMVEPAFFVLKRKATHDQPLLPVRILWAKEGGEEEALRGLRRASKLETPEETDTYSIFTAAPGLVTPATWLPRSKRSAELVERLRRSGMPTVGDVFEVNQGALTGKNSVFILNRKEFLALPFPEQEFFHPAAGSQTIQAGQLTEEQYVFWPYSDHEITITTLQDLTTRVPTYYDKRLGPGKVMLSERAGIDRERWWLLTRDRREWQHLPKLVSAYFGYKGSFSYDADGRFVVVQGYAWLWRRTEDDEGEEFEVPFHRSGLPWAYVAILNSSAFEVLLSCFCPRVQGGQFNLSDRFIKGVYLPDLTDENAVVADDVKELEALGRALVNNDRVDFDRLDSIVARSYGIPLVEWDLDVIGA